MDASGDSTVLGRQRVAVHSAALRRDGIFDGAQQPSHGGGNLRSRESRRSALFGGLPLITIFATWCGQAWCVKWLSKAARRDSMRKACGITTSSATAAAMLRIWSGTKCPSLLQARSASGFFANANSFSGGSAQSALRGALLAKGWHDKHFIDSFEGAYRRKKNPQSNISIGVRFRQFQAKRNVPSVTENRIHAAIVTGGPNS